MPVDPAWLARQRWYGAADRELRSLAVLARDEVAPGLEWQVVEARFADGAPSHYQVFWDEAGGADGAERPEAVRHLFPDLEITSTRLLAGEQSNTSVVTEPGPLIVKVFRRLTPEANPDTVAVRRLWDAGFRGVPEPVGECRRTVGVDELDAPAGGDATGEGLAADGVDLAVARRFLPGSKDGWDLALGARSGFAAEAEALGRLTAEMHLALASALGREVLDGGQVAAGMVTHARRILGAQAPTGPFERLAGVDPGGAIRPHGDYHLGQVLRHDTRWYVLDFEGEPARPVAERVAFSSPLRDVAGMLRSFAYAVAVAGHDAGWEPACRQAFLGGYLATRGIDELLPADPAPVIDAFELDKAIYEVGYERAHRPDWVEIPLAAVRRLTGWTA
jgi:predicted trehalose synthase